MGSYGQIPYACVEYLNFQVYTDEEIKRISVMRVVNDQSINELGHVSAEGVYDLKLGPMSTRDQDLCLTCKQNGRNCHGHCGHIELPLPVYNPVFYSALKKLIMCTCWSCFRYQSEPAQALQFIFQMKLLRKGYGYQALQLGELADRITSGNMGEAEEVAVDVEGNDVKGSEKGYAHMEKLRRLHTELESFCKKTIESDPSGCNTSTSIVKSIQQTITRQFYEDTKPGLVCRFCRCRRLRLSLQNSRFLILNKPSKDRTALNRMKQEPEDIKSTPKREKKSEDSDLSESDSEDGDKPKLVETAGINMKQNDEEQLDTSYFNSSIVADTQTYITPEQLRTALRKCWKNDADLLKCLYPVLGQTENKYPTDMFFLQTLLVMPPKYRPCNYQDGMVLEHETSTVLKNIVKMAKGLTFLIRLVNGSIEELPEALKYILSEIPGKNYSEKCQTVWYQIQGHVDSLFDANLNRLVKVSNKGIRQVIEKKNGLFRRNLMGKRVNYSARSVAAPDPMLAVDEVGVPMDFAIKLSYPVPVTQWNVEELRELVINGPDVYPGALMVENEEGNKKRLHTLTHSQRVALAKQLLTPPESHVRKVNASKIVYRHLKNGDLVLMNRQPTLHRPSIQAHKARVMPNDRVLRMPYANCKAYNADFDGDELNMHFPQNELARSEAHHLVTTHNQYLTPKDGSPLAGLIQDCVVSSVMLTVRGKFFNKEDYQQLLYSALSDQTKKIEVVPPAILKPKMMWSGKQVISSLLLNIIPSTKYRPSFTFKTSVKVDLWQTDPPRKWKGGGEPEKKRESMTESEFIMRDGELLCGVIDKSAIGSTSHGLIHTCYDLYGGGVAAALLTAVNRLCVYYLQWSGHTISVKEFVTPSKVSKQRRDSLAQLIKRTRQEVSKRLEIAEEDFQDYFESSHMSGNTTDMAAIDAAYTAVLGPTTSEVTAENEKGLYRCSLDNHMRMMVDTGSKGSKVNMNQMASLFGSVAIDGKRMPISITGKFLPSFKPYEANPRSGGYIPHRFMTGMDPQAFFYLCIVGRDSLQHTAVKTANSGYLQRCLIKHLEGIQVKYDMTVRNSDGLVLQFNYGEDGLDVTRVPFLKNPDTMDVLVKNYSKNLEERSLSIAKSVGDAEVVQQYTKKLKKVQKKLAKHKGERSSGFIKYAKKMSDTVEAEGYCTKTGRSNKTKTLTKMWEELSPEEREKLEKTSPKMPDPVDSVFSGTSNLGVISEALEDLIDRYYDEKFAKRPLRDRTMEREEVATTVHMKAFRSKVDPGEAVGALCAQAIGEPLTQMTLNTFHFAGRDELNVTLGVPRMVEILRSASKHISTPIMEVPFHKHINRSTADALRRELSEVPLSKVLNGLDVSVKLERDSSGRIHKKTKVKFTFLPHKEYSRIFAVNPSKVLAYMEKHFIMKELLREIQKSFGRKMKYCTSKSSDKEGSGKEPMGEEEAENDLLDDSNPKEVKQPSQDDSSDDDDAQSDIQEDDDGTLASRTNRGKEQDYSEDEDEDNDDDIEGRGGEEGDGKQGRVSEDEGLGEDEEPESESEEVEAAVAGIKKRVKVMSDDEVLVRRNAVMSQDPWIIYYDIDREKELYCEVTFLLPLSGGSYDIPSIVRQKAQRALVHTVPGIKRVFVVEKDDTLMLRTEGVNAFKMYEYEHLLDVNRLYINNIQEVARMYGIEAAQRSIIRELRAVQSAYDIKVDFRHLTLLADYFTCEGVYKACSRQALASCMSPIQKMSYETCTEFLKNALLQGEKDYMNSPSANIAVGQPVKVGTNVMNVLQVIKV